VTTTPHTRAERLQSYLSQDPGNRALRCEVVEAWMAAQRLEQAYTVALEGLSRDPAHAQLRYQRGVIERMTGRLHEATRTLTDLVEELRRSGDPAQVVRLELARVQAGLGQHQACMDVLGGVQVADLPEPLRAEADFLRLRALHQQGDLEAAAEIAERLHREHPAEPAFTAALATLYLDAQRLDDAARLFAQAQAQGGVNAELSAVGGYLALDAADLRAAEHRFELSLSLTPDFGRAWLGLGLTQAANGDRKTARESLAAACRHMPTHLGSWHALAWLQLLDGDLDGAQASFDAALAADRTFGDSHGGLAIIAVLRGQADTARELMRTGHRLDRQSMNVGVAGLLLERGGRLDSPEFLDEALKLLRQHALEHNPQLLTSLGRMLSRRPSGPAPL